jgi:hypothetical protein
LAAVAVSSLSTTTLAVVTLTSVAPVSGIVSTTTGCAVPPPAATVHLGAESLVERDPPSDLPRLERHAQLLVVLAPCYEVDVGGVDLCCRGPPGRRSMPLSELLFTTPPVTPSSENGSKSTSPSPT